ncbi:MAG: hypothetical protein IJU48_00915 [Synergistaceae bacterium]|nr:hypothetical protein [Synergistaceae bacterium]
MDEQGKIISTSNVDDNLALQIWTRGKTPRLSIMNRIKNTRKLIHISWVEKRERTLSMNGRTPGENITYVVKDFEPVIAKILSDYVAKTNFKLKYFKLVVDFEKALHHPEPASSKADLSMMTEEKRSSLWVADCSGGDRNTGIFRPFFPVSEVEASAMPDEKMRITSAAMRTTEGLFKTGAIEALKRINPERWHNTLRVTTAAMLLGFSYCGADGSKMADFLWTADEKPKNPVHNPLSPVMKAPVKKLSLNDAGLMRLGHKLTAYIRHFYIVDKVRVEYGYDSEKVLQEAGYSRSRRFDFNTGTLGDVPYRVTFYENEDEKMTAFGCNPRMQTARHTGDMVILIPTETFRMAAKNDTMSNTDDDFFTLTRLLWAKQFKFWYENIKPYVRNFAGLIEA